MDAKAFFLSPPSNHSQAGKLIFSKQPDIFCCHSCFQSFGLLKKVDRAAQAQA
jgi:hypothetical protein